MSPKCFADLRPTMKLLSPTKFHIPHISYFVVLLSFVSIVLLNPVFANKKCDFPAIFNFGDSNSDTGGLAASLIAPTPPYGETYFHRPAGRFSDGRLIIDFIAQSFGLPYLSAYLDSLGTNFSHGANFATSSSTIRLPPDVIPQGGFSPFFLDIQYTQFKNFKPRTQFIRRQVNDSVPDIANSFSQNIKNIYDLGARSFWIHNTGPIGCLPYILTNFLSAQRDAYGCAKAYNEVAQYFNYKLKEAVIQLHKDLPLAAITYVDTYSVKYSLYTNPEKYGFEIPLITCCGFGGEYNYDANVGCGGTINVNGTKIFVGSCKSPSVKVNWDGIHYTEAASKFIFDQISTGAFSYPPVPLNMACYKS
ncbi:hypothetical protein RJT34_12238 [Clitoria ternatea]|uniref:Uncharacterized protein n=1 Tax=Clitoria ternatea TaxID=43366 RepID=A0AAN9JLF1_CLITE